MSDFFETIVNLRREGIRAALATVTDTKGSTPGRLTQRMIVRADATIHGTVGGGCVEADVVRAALDVIDTGRPKKLKFVLSGEEADRTGLACGGQVEIMIESLCESWVYLLGCGHIGQRVSELAQKVGYRISMIDDRPTYANREVCSAADVVTCTSFSSLSGAVKPAPDSAIIVATRGHAHDYECLKWALTTEARFLGVIGSRAKRKLFFQDLAAEGYEPASLERVEMPVGLPIGAESPMEIAVSVVARLIELRRTGKVSPSAP